MEIKNLYPAVLLFIFIGLLLGVGVLTLDKFGTAVKEDAGFNQTLTMAAGTGTLTNDEVESITSISNQTGVVFTTPLDYNITLATGAITAVNSNMSDTTVNVAYIYKSDQQATTVVNDAVSSLDGIASDWLALIITIVVLAIILTLVTRSFAVKR